MANDYLFLDYDDVVWPIDRSMSSCLPIVCASSQAVFMAKGLGDGGRERDKRKEGGREGGDQGLSADFKGGTELKEREEGGRVNSYKQFI